MKEDPNVELKALPDIIAINKDIAYNKKLIEETDVAQKHCQIDYFIISLKFQKANEILKLKKIKIIAECYKNERKKTDS